MRRSTDRVSEYKNLGDARGSTLARSAGNNDSIDGSDVRKRGDDNFIARSDTECCQRDMERDSTVGDAQSMTYADVCSKALFERYDIVSFTGYSIRT